MDEDRNALLRCFGGFLCYVVSQAAPFTGDAGEILIVETWPKASRVRVLLSGGEVCQVPIVPFIAPFRAGRPFCVEVKGGSPTWVPVRIRGLDAYSWHVRGVDGVVCFPYRWVGMVENVGFPNHPAVKEVRGLVKGRVSVRHFPVAGHPTPRTTVKGRWLFRAPIFIRRVGYYQHVLLAFSEVLFEWATRDRLWDAANCRPVFGDRVSFYLGVIRARRRVISYFMNQLLVPFMTFFPLKGPRGILFNYGRLGRKFYEVGCDYVVYSFEAVNAVHKLGLLQAGVVAGVDHFLRVAGLSYHLPWVGGRAGRQERILRPIQYYFFLQGPNRDVCGGQGYAIRPFFGSLVFEDVQGVPNNGGDDVMAVRDFTAVKRREQVLHGGIANVFRMP